MLKTRQVAPTLGGPGENVLDKFRAPQTLSLEMLIKHQSLPKDQSKFQDHLSGPYKLSAEPRQTLSQPSKHLGLS